MLLIIAATPMETKLLSPHPDTQEISPDPHTLGTTDDGKPISLLHTGIGPISTAISLTRQFERQPPDAVLMIGCGGSYPGSGLQIGDLALATEEIFGDLGASTPEGFTPLAELDIPVHPAPAERIRLDSNLWQAAEAILREERPRGQQLQCGPFVTVNCCSGTRKASEDLERRTGGICENMEGAAAAQACADYRIPLLELRGISNPTGTRDPAQWDVVRGAEAAQVGLRHLLNHWSALEQYLCSN